MGDVMPRGFTLRLRAKASSFLRSSCCREVYQNSHTIDEWLNLRGFPAEEIRSTDAYHLKLQRLSLVPLAILELEDWFVQQGLGRTWAVVALISAPQFRSKKKHQSPGGCRVVTVMVWDALANLRPSTTSTAFEEPLALDITCLGMAGPALALPSPPHPPISANHFSNHAPSGSVLV